MERIETIEQIKARLAQRQVFSVMGSSKGDGGIVSASDAETAVALFLSEGDMQAFAEIFGEVLVIGEEREDGSFVFGDYVVRKA